VPIPVLLTAMRYENVCLETLAYTLPDEVVTSAQIEAQLEPLYRRLKLPEGRLELMTGIHQRRFWPADMLPSRISVETGDKAIRCAGIDRREIGVLIHGSVCRDQLEPATACAVHQQLGLTSDCAVFDVSNACLGLMNGVVLAANMIELGQIRAGLVVGTENGRALVETTIAMLNSNTSLSRNDIKAAIASLTIGSASAAVLLVDGRRSRTGNRLVGGVVRTYTEHSQLCQGGGNGSGDSREPLMWTDSEALLHAGVAAAKDSFAEFQSAVGWSVDQIQKSVCHQVGRAHRKLILDELEIDPSCDYTTFERLGNTGSTALPVTAAMATESGHVRPGERLAMLGIGSGINVAMLGVQWQRRLEE
jgi:3-oxoacyl-[acyl-carrier-protein] synthase-3